MQKSTKLAMLIAVTAVLFTFVGDAHAGPGQPPVHDVVAPPTHDLWSYFLSFFGF